MISLITACPSPSLHSHRFSLHACSSPQASDLPQSPLQVRKELVQPHRHTQSNTGLCMQVLAEQASRTWQQPSLERYAGIDFLADMCDAATCKVESAGGATHMRLATRFSSAILASGLLKHITTVLLSADTQEMACAGLCVDYLVQAMLAHPVRSHAEERFWQTCLLVFC